jgi:hypothetical protein
MTTDLIRRLLRPPCSRIPPDEALRLLGESWEYWSPPRPPGKGRA